MAFFQDFRMPPSGMRDRQKSWRLAARIFVVMGRKRQSGFDILALALEQLTHHLVIALIQLVASGNEEHDDPQGDRDVEIEGLDGRDGLRGLLGGGCLHAVERRHGQDRTHNGRGKARAGLLAHAHGREHQALDAHAVLPVAVLDRVARQRVLHAIEGGCQSRG